MKKPLQKITAVYHKKDNISGILNKLRSITSFKKRAGHSLILLMAVCLCGLIYPNKVFASRIQVTLISVGSQTGTATYGTAAPTITYAISLTKGSTGGTQANDVISLAWTSSTPSLNSVVFSSGPSYNPASVSTTITLTISTTSSTQAGSYPFTITNVDNNGGGTKTSTGTLVISKLALTITGLSAIDKVYDGGLTATLSGTGTLVGVLPGDINTVSLAGSPTGTFSSANVGSRTVTVSGYTLTGASAGNYSLTQPSGLTANITAAPLTITANTQSKTYGTSLTSVAGITAFSSSGLVNGEKIGSVTITYGTGGTGTSAVGTYTGQATPSAATGGTFSASNYTISYVAGDLVVNPATLTITADNVSITYGSTPTLTATYSGFVNGDTQSSVVSTSAILSSTGGATSSVGTYPISISGAVLNNSNYTIKYVQGTLTITAATLTISADNQYMVVNSTVPAYTVSYSGFVNSDTQGSIVTTAPTVTASPSPVNTSTTGAYTLTPSGAVLNTSNYTISYVTGTLTIVAANYDWTGAAGTSDWTNPGNWAVSGMTATTYPGSSTGSSDAVNIGVSASYTNIPNFPVITNTLTNSISILTVGSNGGASSLTVNSGATLTVTGTMTVNASANFTVTGGGSLAINNDFTNSGTVTFGTGPVTFGNNFTNNSGGIITFGTGLVTFNSTTGTTKNPTFIRSAPPTTNAPVTFYNLTLGSNGHFQFKSSIGTGNAAVFCLASNGVLTVGSSTVVNVSNSGFTLLSDATGSAAVAAIPSSSPLNGNFNVQRFITGGNNSIYRCYRMLTSPVYTSSSGSYNTISLAYLNATNTVGTKTYYGAFTGGPGTGFSVVNSNPTIYVYNESLPINNDHFTSGKHVGISSITGNTVTTMSIATGTVVYTSGVSIPAGNGFILFFVGSTYNRTTGSPTILPTDATMTATGSLNQGDVKVNLWYTPTGGTAGQLSYTSSLGATGAGYNMVGNPYASTIDLYSVLTNNTGIDAIYTLSPTGPSQSYTVYTASGSSAPATYFAVSGQGFIVHAINTGQTLTFHETDKSATTQLTGANLLMGTPVQGPSLTGLYLKLQKDSVHYDYTGIYFGTNWSDAFENGDATYFNGNSINMASLSSDGKMLAVNHLHTYTNDNRVRLYTNALLGGDYTLKIEGIRNIDTTYDIYLVDHYKKDSVNIRQTGAYAFNILKTDTASFGANRFELAIHRNPAYAYQLLSFTAQQIAHSPHVALTWKTKNELNNNFTVERSNDGGNTFAVAGGMQGTGAGLYSLTDKNAMDGQNLYRLKSEDINNNITYSQFAEVMISGNGNADKVRVYPNPTTSAINLDVLGKTNTTTAYTITVSNSTGFIVKQATSSQSSWQANVSDLMPGTYVVRVTDSQSQTFVGESKFIKL
jgi:lipopolysaccharide export system protein LptA